MATSEEALIARIVELFGQPDAIVGIGDDGAVVRAPEREVVTTDLLIEGIDFTRAIPLRLVAAKSLSANLSDLAAMGAKARRFVMSLGIPADLLESFDPFLEGMAAAAKRWRVELVGGDLSRARDLTISITAFGELAPGVQPLTRSGARSGEGVFVSRPLGGAAAGLTLFARGWTLDPSGGAEPPGDLPASPGYAHRELAASVLRQHAAPEPELELGFCLAATGEVTSCIDVSDGLSTDLDRICRASGLGALVEWERVPRFPDLERCGLPLGIDVERCVLHGGEELALLFTSRLSESELSARAHRPVYRIGRMIEGEGVALQRGEVSEPLPPRGFDHFAAQ
ncbi:MAG TPA: thiamine-phosphate kinase [Thermoanaerobaculia bacterium]|nr:thiamine-phosphate kinase [Thermoanaerobaculia bacterium]